jgi:putative tryptophan/tyrosine transport system substrate-binding protein
LDSRSDYRKWKTCTELIESGNKMTRVGLLLLACLILLWVSLVPGQARGARIGVLGAPEEPRFSEIVAGLKQGLRELGVAEQSIDIVEGRVPRGDLTSEHAVVERMLQQRVQLLFAIGSRLVTSVRRVSADLPIVFITPGDPVASGLVASLARPGGNAIGMTFEYPELSGKRLELLKEMAPKIRRVLTMYDPGDDSPKQGVAAAKDAAPKLGIVLIERQTRSSDDVIQSLKALSDADAFLAIPGGQPTAHYKEIIQAANAKRLPTIFHAHTGSTQDALASYGANDPDIARQAARLVDKVLRGTKAGEIPVERPTKLQFIVNLKTARQIGLTIPPNVLARADKVIK